MILNEDYDFDRQTPPDVLLSFRTPPGRVLLEPEEKLYRFVTMGHNETIAGFWIPGDSYERLETWSRQLGMPIQHLARSTLAVMMEWNPKMNAVSIVELKLGAYGLRGPAKYQPLSKTNSKILLMGNMEQVWVPNLSWEHVFVEYRQIA
ncbi:MAG TPA: hypothetical protein VG204_01820 [Terriglobia bacterium]|nr:hypothetical protein [Terriglobia bacterium]